jgi:sulfatase maturation enzyme AslB (radical SAM superfamily)
MEVGSCQVVVRVQRKMSDPSTALRELATDPLFPGAAVALARWLAKAGRPEDALAIARDALSGLQGSKQTWDFHILRNQITALERTIAGKRVHRALQRYLGDDDGYMLSRTCEFPFNRIDLQENGNAAVCCAHWMPGFSLGNVITGKETASEIFNNSQAVAARQSVLDGSFRYCDHEKCPLISGQQLPSKADVPGDNAKRAVATGEVIFESPSFVLLAFDQSCNLSCPSCRADVITEKMGMQTLKEKLVEESIIPMLRGAKTLNINPAGEIFVSRPLRRLLSKLNSTAYPGLKIEIITNGTLFNKREWEKFPGIHGMVTRVRVSTDGATKETFEKLRRGAHWETFIENMRFLGELRRSGAIDALMFSFTYQRDNFREMSLFVDVTHDIDPGRIVIFEKLENWGTFRNEDYLDKAVHLLEHPLHDEFLAIIRQPKMKPFSSYLFSDYDGLI